MTNNQIILVERIDLMKKGIIKSTGKAFKLVDATGKEVVIKEPEEIHTYAAWQELGYQVQKGQKAVIGFPIWKYVNKKKFNDEDDEENHESMFLKTSAFFTAPQVASISEKRNRYNSYHILGGVEIENLRQIC